jgi:hypothetical protein
MGYWRHYGTPVTVRSGYADEASRHVAEFANGSPLCDDVSLTVIQRDANTDLWMIE